MSETSVEEMKEPMVAASGKVYFPEMKIVNERPPVWKEVCAMIGMAPRETIFAWGNIIYNPDDIEVADYLIRHEEVHQRQQYIAGGPAAWWSRYLDDVYFRLSQEVEAYAVQYNAMLSTFKDRNMRFRIKVDLARKLAGPLYGNSITNSAAMAMLDKELKRIA